MTKNLGLELESLQPKMKAHKDEAGKIRIVFFFFFKEF